MMIAFPQSRGLFSTYFDKCSREKYPKVNPVPTTFCCAQVLTILVLPYQVLWNEMCILTQCTKMYLVQGRICKWSTEKY